MSTNSQHTAVKLTKAKKRKAPPLDEASIANDIPDIKKQRKNKTKLNGQEDTSKIDVTAKTKKSTKTKATSYEAGREDPHHLDAQITNNTDESLVGTKNKKKYKAKAVTTTTAHAETAEGGDKARSREKRRNKRGATESEDHCAFGEEVKEKSVPGAEGHEEDKVTEADHVGLGKKKRKHKSKGEDVDGEAEVNVANRASTSDAEMPEQKRTKTKRKAEASHEDIAGYSSARVEGKATKLSKDLKETETPITPAAASTSPEKKRSKKKHKSEVGDVDTAAHLLRAVDEKSIKKKRSRDSRVVDTPVPSTDETLPEKARNALQYAYNRLATPTEWKFNKALQNWLVRNFWSEDAIPEKYVSIVVRYLADSQGSVRTNLIKKCRSTVADIEPTTTTDTPQDLTEPQTNPARAFALLGVLEDTST